MWHGTIQSTQHWLSGFAKGLDCSMTAGAVIDPYRSIRGLSGKQLTLISVKRRRDGVAPLAGLAYSFPYRRSP